MLSSVKRLVALDVGERRIGVALGDTLVRLASPYTTLHVDGSEVNQIQRLVEEQSAETIVIGYPRNSQGEKTAQTAYVLEFAKKLQSIPVQIVFQDESLTSVLAEDRLKSHKKPYSKEDIDAYAAAIILDDYLEVSYAAGL